MLNYQRIYTLTNHCQAILHRYPIKTHQFRVGSGRQILQEGGEDGAGSGDILGFFLFRASAPPRRRGSLTGEMGNRGDVMRIWLICRWQPPWFPILLMVTL